LAGVLVATNAGNLIKGAFTGNLAGNATTATSATSATTATAANTSTIFTGNLSGDVTGTQSATVVSAVGGVIAANVAGGANAANAATSANTPSTIVKRDASGNFSAGTITATSFERRVHRQRRGVDRSHGCLAGHPSGHGAHSGGCVLDGDSLDGETDAIPVISVTVSAFYMDVNLVSFSQWQSVYYWATSAGYGFDNAGSGKAANNPCQTVNWYDCVKWCNARSQQAGLTPVYYTDTNLTQVYTNGDVDAVYANWTATGYRCRRKRSGKRRRGVGLSGQAVSLGNLITENLANYYGDTADYSYDLDRTASTQLEA